ncbi:MAG: hypothetical protein Ct9H90mP16_18260 [Candidatus Poseidoniales archaeon]|nr:MAG: hypothetical protein Ct9H90mP16_18260 [Candidatus Poseidoniales archaeon]
MTSVEPMAPSTARALAVRHRGPLRRVQPQTLRLPRPTAVHNSTSRFGGLGPHPSMQILKIQLWVWGFAATLTIFWEMTTTMNIEAPRQQSLNLHRIHFR